MWPAEDLTRAIVDDMHLASVGCRAPWAVDCGPGRYGVGSAVPAVAAASWYASAAAAPATANACETRDWPSKATLLEQH